MIVASLRESSPETRTALSPKAVIQLQELNISCKIETNAGKAAGFDDAAYAEAGAKIVARRKHLLSECHILLTVTDPDVRILEKTARNAFVIAPFQKDLDEAIEKTAQNQNLTLISMTHVPRISRAQSLDCLSSQANLAGYRAVIEACSHYQRVIPMMMTAAGMIHPAKVLVLGAGVAGLQAIATAKRLGADVFAFDVRKAAKEQVESLGAHFVEVSHDEDAETSSGYAQESSAAYRKQQEELIHEYSKKSDIVITTALIPGKKAPELISKSIVEEMKRGAVIVDLASSEGGNCALTQMNKVTQHNGVTIVGYCQLARFLPATASEFYANNFIEMIRLICSDDGQITINHKDEILKESVILHQGKKHPFKEKEHV